MAQWTTLVLLVGVAVLAAAGAAGAAAGAVLASASSSSCPAECSCFLLDFPVTVDCSNRNLTDLPSPMPVEVNELDASDNAFGAIPASALQNLTHLRSLSLAETGLRALPSGWLRGAKELRTLDLSANAALTSLEALGGALRDAPGLLVLNLSRCGVASVDGAAGQLRSATLQVLDLSGCRLSELPASLNLLAGLPALNHLNLSRNPLVTVQGLRSAALVSLDLSHCRSLDSLPPGALAQLPALRRLDVSYNFNFAFAPVANQTLSLRELVADHASLPLHYLKCCPGLEWVSLRHNGVPSIGSANFNNARLRWLDLSNNDIHRVNPVSFRGLPALQTLNMSSNKVELLDRLVFTTNKNLTAVDLSRNPLQELVNFSSEALQYLNLSSCDIKDLSPYALEDMPRLISLDLSSNKLHQMPANLSSASLRQLDLSECKLWEVTNYTFRRLPELRALDLSGNSFTTPPSESVFASNPRLGRVGLSGNPWRCDCQDGTFRNFAEFMLGVDSQEVTERALCESPAAVRNKTWTGACYAEWHPPREAGREAARRYGMAMLASFAVVGGGLVVVSGVRSALRKRKKNRERQRQREIDRQVEERERELRRQLRREMGGGRRGSDGSDDEYFQRRRPHRSPSEITQPPTYEEALLLSRSQQDLLEARVRRAEGEAETAAGAALDAAGVAAVAAAVPSARHITYEVEAPPPLRSRAPPKPKRASRASFPPPATPPPPPLTPPPPPLTPPPPPLTPPPLPPPTPPPPGGASGNDSDDEGGREASTTSGDATPERGPRRLGGEAAGRRRGGGGGSDASGEDSDGR